ncbi:hypothetical protein [Rhizobium ruizarguesonis]|uniref:hypothetical protein n=1 Tax=Rhizobium ruizarguesonis TaxID=2081791 RepID=UPI001FF04366|nr:hypothetical protein [Rhizobium ruizarguesonis]
MAALADRQMPCLFNFDVDQSIQLSSTLPSSHWFKRDRPPKRSISSQWFRRQMLTHSKASERHRHDPKLAFIRS